MAWLLLPLVSIFANPFFELIRLTDSIIEELLILHASFLLVTILIAVLITIDWLTRNVKLQVIVLKKELV